MSNSISGVVQVVSEKATARSKLYSLKVNDAWYSNNFDKPKCKKGDMISFEYDETQYGNSIIKDSIIVMESKVYTAPATGSAGSSAVNKDQYWSNKEAQDVERQRMINHQSARNAAIETVALALQNGAISLGAAKAKMFDNMMNYIDEITSKYFDDLYGKKGDKKDHEDHSAPEDGDWEE